jgi:hypothetical protein
LGSVFYHLIFFLWYFLEYQVGSVVLGESKVSINVKPPDNGLLR